MEDDISMIMDLEISMLVSPIKTTNKQLQTNKNISVKVLDYNEESTEIHRAQKLRMAA